MWRCLQPALGKPVCNKSALFDLSDHGRSRPSQTAIPCNPLQSLSSSNNVVRVPVRPAASSCLSERDVAYVMLATPPAASAAAPVTVLMNGYATLDISQH